MQRYVMFTKLCYDSGMPQFSPSLIKDYRAQTFRTAPGLRLTNADQAVEFVNQRGFIFFWPNKGVDLPNLWSAAAGDRPVADEHDDPGHMTWGWKDGLLGQRRWYYGRVVKHRNAMISLAALPYFYALSPNYGDPENDYLEQYEQGILTSEAKSIYETLLREGPLDTIALRKAARLSSRESDGRYNKALDTLQMEFKLLPIGVAPVGAWRYAFIYELTHRHFPELIEQASQIYEADARQHLAALTIASLGATPLSALSRLFGWDNEMTEKSLAPHLANDGWTRATYPGHDATWIGLTQLVDPSSSAKE
jgi:hypothetical protein